MNKQPILILLIYFMLGIILQEYLSFQFRIAIFIAVTFFVLVFLVFTKCHYFQRIKNYILGLFFFSIGVLAHGINSEEPLLPNLKSNENVVFKLIGKLNSNEKSKRYVIEIISLPSKSIKNFAPFKVVLAVPNEDNLLDYNNFYSSDVYIHKPQDRENNYQFDYKTYLSRQDIYFQAYAYNQILKTEKNNLSFSEHIKQLHLVLLQKINQSSLSPKVQEFLKGIILSDRTEMDYETVLDFNQTGLSHLLAISGSHMVVIFWLCLFAFSRIIPVKFRKLSIILSVAFIWFFAIFIDYGNSVVRSCIMITCYYMMVLLQRIPDLLHSMALSAFVILIIDSQQLFDVGFQLSYIAVLGIWWLMNPIKRLYRIPRSWLENFLYDVAAMTLAAQIATLPLVIFYFHQFSLISIFANLIIIPLSEIIILSSLAMVIMIAIGVKIKIIFKLFDLFISKILEIIHWFADFETLMHRQISIQFFEICSLFIVIYCLRFVIRDYKNLKYELSFMSSIFIFLILRLSYNMNHFENNEILIHKSYADKIISVKSYNHVDFWIEENSKHEKKLIEFVVNPYLYYRRVDQFQIHYYPANTKAIIIGNEKFNLK